MFLKCRNFAIMDNQRVKKTFVAINLIRIIIQLLQKKRKISKKILGSANVIATKIKRSF